MNLRKKIILSTAIACSHLSAQNGPNIIYILADDLGYGDLQCLNRNSQIPTPNMDKIGREGMQFSDAHSGSAVSTPTRYGILTGRYCFRSPLKNGVLFGYDPPLIEKNRTTVASMLQQSGYETAIIGKWHLGLGWVKQDESKKLYEGNVQTPTSLNIDFASKLSDSPNDHGFGYSYIIPGSLDMNPYVYIENGKVVNASIRKMDGCSSPRGVFWRSGTASDDFVIPKTLDNFAGKTVDYINEYKSSKPLFLYIPLPAPHAPWTPDAKYIGKSGAGLYGDYVCHVDDVIGRILEAIDKKGWNKNTLIVLTSDNGAHWTEEDKMLFPKHEANDRYKGQKSDAWDGGHRVPFLVRWPSQVKAGSKSNALICLTDLMATCAEITGQKLPQGVGEDSFSMLSVLRDQSNSKTIRSNVVHHSIKGIFAIRIGKWKYIDAKDGGGWTSASKSDTLPGQRFDMKNDPSEKNNLYKKKPKMVAAMKSKLESIKE